MPPQKETGASQSETEIGESPDGSLTDTEMMTSRLAMPMANQVWGHATRNCVNGPVVVSSVLLNERSTKLSSSISSIAASSTENKANNEIAPETEPVTYARQPALESLPACVVVEPPAAECSKQRVALERAGNTTGHKNLLVLTVGENSAEFKLSKRCHT